VISVSPEQSTRDIAEILLRNRISAVPVIDADGVPIGVVSEGDLIGRLPIDRLARTDWWLAVAAGGQPLDDDFRSRLQASDRTARDVMSAPLVTVSEDTHVGDIAKLFAIHRIKRVPVVRDGAIVGIVSRADLLHVVALTQPRPAAQDEGQHQSFLRGLFGEYKRPAWEVALGARPAEPSPKRDNTRIAAEDFRGLVEDCHRGETQHHDETRRKAAQQRSKRATELIDVHVFDAGWRQMLQNARAAAEKAELEYLLLRFPNQLCIDGGRAINNAEGSWPATLRGEPAEIYLRWERELKPQGFSMTARVLEFPDGMPGDVGLFLVWGAEAKQ
jgi:CBS domain-containing protein